jgi:hypothetical protein
VSDEAAKAMDRIAELMILVFLSGALCTFALIFDPPFVAAVFCSVGCWHYRPTSAFHLMMQPLRRQVELLVLSLVSSFLCVSAVMLDRPILAFVFAVLSAAAGVIARTL